MGKRERRRARDAARAAHHARLIELSESAATLVEVHNRRALSEASIRTDGTCPLTIITPGWGSSGYYSAATLEAAADARVFPAGTHMYLDHPTLSEVVERPGERSVRDLAAVLVTDGHWDANGVDGPGIYAEAQILAHHRPVIAELAPWIGVSIRAAGESTIGEAEGRRGQIIDRIVEARSVDFVVEAGRGGQIRTILESAAPHPIGEALGDWTYEDLRQALRAALQDRFPADDTHQHRWVWMRDITDTEVIYDLEDGSDNGTFTLGYTLADRSVTLDGGEPVEVTVRTSYEPASTPARVEEAATPPTKGSDMFKSIEEASARVATLTGELDEAKKLGEYAAAERDQLRTDNARLREAALEGRARTRAAAAVGELCVLAGIELRPTSVARIVDEACRTIPTTDSGDLDETAVIEAVGTSVQRELDVLAEYGVGAGNVQGLGGGTPPAGDSAVTEAAAEKLKSGFARLGLSETAAATAAAGRR